MGRESDGERRTSDLGPALPDEPPQWFNVVLIVAAIAAMVCVIGLLA